MDAPTIEMLQNGPSSVGFTARAYATAFKQIAPVTVTDQRMFNHILQSILIRRENEIEGNQIGQKNLLVPATSKGIGELYRIYECINDQLSPFCKRDLPTMILYAMLLENASYREGFAKMSHREIETLLGIVYKEVKSVCHYQVLTGELVFIKLNSLLSQIFIAEADISLTIPISRKITNEGFYPENDVSNEVLIDEIRNAPGSVGDYARNISKSFKLASSSHISNVFSFIVCFDKIIEARGEIYRSLGENKSNFLIPVSQKGTSFIHSLIDDTASPDDRARLKIDLPTHIFYSILLESENKRVFFVSVEDDLLLLSLRILYEEVNTLCSYQVSITKDQFISYGTKIVGNMKTYLLKS